MSQTETFAHPNGKSSVTITARPERVFVHIDQSPGGMYIEWFADSVDNAKRELVEEFEFEIDYVDDERGEEDVCERGTLGCCVHHVTRNGKCETW